MAIKEGTHTGLFELVDGRKVFGVLELDGRNTSLSLYADDGFPPVPKAYKSLHGLLHDGTHVFLMNCVLLSANSSYGSAKKCSARIFPNTSIFGPSSVAGRENEITSCSFSLSETSSVFYAFDAFSSVLDPKPFIPHLAADRARVRGGDLGARPIIGYFNGLFEIARVQTCLGEIETRYRIEHSMGGPLGWNVAGQIWISINFEAPVSIREAMSRANSLIRFFDLVAGRRQEILGFECKYQWQSDAEQGFDIYEAHAPRPRDDKGASISGRRSPGPRDVLLCTFEGSEPYEKVVSNYLKRDAVWRDARVRLRDGVGRNSYSVDRIVSAANMFDILPSSALPSDQPISPDLERARDEAKELFRSLPDSIERNSVLGALGRIGKSNLKQKVLHRMKVARLDEKFGGLDLVLKEAVNCRNHYVHGSPAAIDYYQNFEFVSFFTDALEFVFGVSDLVECGWDFDAWLKGHPQTDHPYGAFILEFRERERRLNAALNK